MPRSRKSVQRRRARVVKGRGPVRKGADALAAAAVIAAGTQAYGEQIRFENEGGQFDWLFNTLDVRLPADQQPGVQGGPSSIYQNYFGDFYPTFSYQHTYSQGPGAEVFASGFSNGYAKPHDAGTPIGPGLIDGAWQQNMTFEFDFVSCDYYTYKCTSGNRGLLPEGVDTYLGVRFDAGAGNQYGWVGVNRGGAFIDVFAWGYETEPGVSIPAGAPEPGTLAMLAFGFVAAAGARRR